MITLLTPPCLERTFVAVSKQASTKAWRRRLDHRQSQGENAQLDQHMRPRLSEDYRTSILLHSLWSIAVSVHAARYCLMCNHMPGQSCGWQTKIFCTVWVEIQLLERIVGFTLLDLAYLLQVFRIVGQSSAHPVGVLSMLPKFSKCHVRHKMKK